MNKQKTKLLWRGAGVPTAAWEQLGPSFDPEAVVQRLGLPIMVKPASEGSSIGMSKVTRAEALDEIDALLPRIHRHAATADENQRTLRALQQFGGGRHGVLRRTRGRGRLEAREIGELRFRRKRGFLQAGVEGDEHGRRRLGARQDVGLAHGLDQRLGRSLLRLQQIIKKLLSFPLPPPLIIGPGVGAPGRGRAGIPVRNTLFAG